jgi:hypothetical protein
MAWGDFSPQAMAVHGGSGMNIEKVANSTLKDVKFLGTDYASKVDEKKLAEQVLASPNLKGALKKAGLDDIANLLDKIKNMDNASKDTKQKLKELMEKIKEAAQEFGLRIEVSLGREGSTLVRIFNRLNNQLVTTIPMQILLKALIAANNGQGKAGYGTTPQEIESLAQLTGEQGSSPTRTEIII